MPLSVPFRGASVPLPAVLGALLSFAGWVGGARSSTPAARYVGLGWLLGGLVLYVTYRKTESKPLLRRVTIPERALRHEALEPEFGSILVPIFGSQLDDDIIQTAGRLAAETRDEPRARGPVIEAVWVFELPLSLPLDAPLPEAQVERAPGGAGAGQGGRRGVRGRDRGHHRRARAAHRPGDRQRGPASAGWRRSCSPPRSRRGSAAARCSAASGGPLDNYVGEITKYVIRKAPCRVILTAPPAEPNASRRAGAAEADRVRH